MSHQKQTLSSTSPSPLGRVGVGLFRRFRKSLSLRIVNWLGLSVMFACMLLSYSYVKREFSYDRFHANAGRIARLSLQENDHPVDGRIYGDGLDPLLQQIPGIEQVVKLSRPKPAVFTCRGKKQVVNDLYFAGANFFDVFSVPVVKGGVMQSEQQVMVSESLARQLFDDVDREWDMNDIHVNSMNINGSIFHISGIFKDMPEESHFHADILLYRPDAYNDLNYVYLLQKEPVNPRELEQKITQLIEKEGQATNSAVKTRALLTPLTDIRLHSHYLREMEVNGDIRYIYLVAGANLLLLVVVLFNLWLNASLIFSYSRRYYQMLRMNGASASTVIRDESLIAALLGLLSTVAGVLAAGYASSAGYFRFNVAPLELTLCCLAFLALTVLVSALPVVKNMSATLFLNARSDLRPVRFSYANVKYMLTAQYAVMMMVVILASGITRQMNMVKEMQAGGDERNMLVMKAQPYEIQAKYALLKSELLKYPGIEMATTAFQLPGDAIRDIVQVRKDDNAEKLPLMIVGEDFLPFFRIKTIAGKGFSPASYDFQTEEQMLLDHFNEGVATGISEEYIVNRKALAVLGIKTPEDAIGQTLRIEHGTVAYFNCGTIVGVTDDFNYTSLYESAIPMLIMQRNTFQHCLMVRFDPAQAQQSLAAFHQVWDEVNPDYPADYTFMNEIFGHTYRNELNAERLVYVFSALCIVVAALGLIIFMAFIIKRRTREVAIRKVNGAGIRDILLLLNVNFIRRIALAFVIAVPVAWYAMHRWLEHFACRISLSWQLFALAGLSVMALSLALVSVQSWRAAMANPVEAIKTE
jgi:putative ABC transport system permease protein